MRKFLGRSVELIQANAKKSLGNTLWGKSRDIYGRSLTRETYPLGAPNAPQAGVLGEGTTRCSAGAAAPCGLSASSAKHP